MDTSKAESVSETIIRSSSFASKTLTAKGVAKILFAAMGNSEELHGMIESLNGWAFHYEAEEDCNGHATGWSLNLADELDQLVG